MRETDEAFAEQLFADQHTIDTPEQVTLNLPVASVGSRLLAILVDSLLQGLVVITILFVLVLVAMAAPHQASATPASKAAAKWVIAGFIVMQFLLFWGYFSLFEAFWNGQTPGKRLMKLRVLADSGRPITLFESMTRNLIRIIDMIPSIYLVGLVTMLCNRHAKRLGDLLAGTIVVHESALPHGATATPTSWLITPEPRIAVPAAHVLPHGVPADALARLAPADIQLLERFFARNLDLEPHVRYSMASSIAAHLAETMQWSRPDRDTRPERMLEAVEQALYGR